LSGPVPTEARKPTTWSAPGGPRTAHCRK
jgi:hypothetical protein